MHPNFPPYLVQLRRFGLKPPTALFPVRPIPLMARAYAKGFPAVPPVSHGLSHMKSARLPLHNPRHALLVPFDLVRQTTLIFSLSHHPPCKRKYPNLTPTPLACVRSKHATVSPCSLARPWVSESAAAPPTISQEERNLLPIHDKLPEVQCVARARIPTVQGLEIFLHLYPNNVDNKEHLAIVFGEDIRSKSLSHRRPRETQHDRMTRGAYVGKVVSRAYHGGLGRAYGPAGFILPRTRLWCVNQRQLSPDRR